MNAQTSQAWISEEEYLRSELISPVRREYVDGHVYVMADVSKNHARISGNVLSEIGNHLEGSPCEPFGSNLKVKVGSQFFYPDMMVVCDDQSLNEYYTQSPVLIVEVLSRHTRKTDETTKRLAYLSIPSLREYVLIEQDIVDVEVCRRSEGWVSSHYFMGDAVPLESIGLSLAVEDIYARVENEDVRLYFEEQAASNPPPEIPASA